MLKTSISSKIALFTCLFVLLTGIVVAMGFSVESQRAMLDHEIEIVNNQLRDAGSIILQKIQVAKQDLQLLARLTHKQESETSVLTAIKLFLEEKPLYRSISIRRLENPGGQYSIQQGQFNIQLLDPGLPELKSEKKFYFQPTSSGENSSEGRNFDIIFISPFRSAISIGITIDLNYLVTEVVRTLSKSQELYLTNNQGEILIHPIPKLGAKDEKTIQKMFPELSEVYQSQQMPLVNLYLRLKHNQRDLMAFYERLKFPGVEMGEWFLLSIVPYREITQKPMDILNRSVLITIILFTFSFLLVFLFAKSAARDILLVADATYDFLRGKPIERLPVYREDEIGKLAKMFKQMTREYGEKSMALINSEMRYRQIVETTDEGVVVVDKQYNTQFVNQRLADLLGYPVSELINRSLYDFIDNEARSVIISNQGKIGESAKQFDVCFTRKDGSKLWALLNVSPLKDDKDNYTGMLAMVNDITNRKMAEQALMHSQARFESLFQEAPIALIESNLLELRNYLLELDDNHTSDLLGLIVENPDYLQQFFDKVEILSMNKAAITTLRVNSVEEFAHNMSTIFEDVNLEKLISVIVDICINGRNTEGDICMTSVGDEPIHLRFRTIIPSDSADCSRVLTGFVDISERLKIEKALRESEQRYALMASEQRVLLENTQDFVYRRDIHGKLTYISPAVETITGYRVEQMNNDFHTYLSDSDMNKEYLEFYHQQQKNNKNEYLFQIEFNTTTGSKILEINERPYVEMGEVKYYVGVARDVSMRYGMELQLKHSQEELRELAGHLQSAREEEHARIAREIHDEFGQVLMALNMDIHWIKRHMPKDKTFIEKADSMSKLINIATSTVQRLLNDLRPIILDDLGLVQALDWYVNEFTSRTRIKCSLDNQLSESEFEKDFATTVFRLVQEALTNIAKHANATQVDIQLFEDRSNLSISIKDNGIGIKEKPRDVGKSFGLIGMRERTLAIGGILKITSEPGKGTHVWISLPLSKAHVSIPA